MNYLARLRSWLKWMVKPRRLENEMEAEVRFHLESYAADLVRNGVSEPEAMRRARIEFGGVESHKDAMRASLGQRFWSELLVDVRYGGRMLRKNPGFAAIAVASLALGIGANTAIFTLAKAALLDTLSVPHPDQLRLLTWTQDDRSLVSSIWGDFYPDGNGHSVVASFSYPVYQQLRRNHALGDLFAFKEVIVGRGRLTATIDDQPTTVTGELVSGNYFAGFGVGTVVGRPIEPADDVATGAPVAVISNAFWERSFGRSPTVIGKTIKLNLIPVTIVGVAPPGFTGASHVEVSPDLFLPLSTQPVIVPRETGSILTDPEIWWVQVMGRLQPGISESAARASLAVTLDQAVRATMTVPKDATLPPLSLSPGARGWLSYEDRQLEQPSSILLVLAGLVLLLACANIANLLLARSAARQREMSVRIALGASKARIVRQLLTESLMLSMLGGIAGLALGYAGRDAIPRLLLSKWGSEQFASRFDWRVFAFTMAISALSGLLFGVGPAWQATRAIVNAGLKDSAGTATRRSKGFAGKTLVIVQVSLCMLLLVGAGLFVRTLANLNSIDTGFRPKGILLFAISPPKQRYPAPKNVEVLHQIEESIASLPGVKSVALSADPLLAQTASNDGFFPDNLPDGQPPKAGREQFTLLNSVGQNFFATMGIPVLYGRAFDFRDTPTSPKVAIINRALARKEFAGINPVGKTFTTDEKDRYEIIGVSADAKYADLRDDPPPTFYVLYLQQKDDRDDMTFEVRTSGDPAGLVGAIRAVVQSVDKDLPLIDVRTQSEQIRSSLAPERIFATLAAGFGALALILASIGVYGIMAQTVARRVNEIGVRMALGAPARQVLVMILRETSWLSVIGIGAGLGAALLLTRFLSSMLFGLKPTDPLTLTFAAVLLFAIAMLAGWGPARRASLIQPMQALRHE
jgi:predicted permease